MALPKSPSDITHLFSDPQHFQDADGPILALAEQIARMTYVGAHVPDHGKGLVQATEALSRVLQAEAAVRVARLDKELRALVPAVAMGPSEARITILPRTKE